MFDGTVAVFDVGDDVGWNGVTQIQQQAPSDPIGVIAGGYIALSYDSLSVRGVRHGRRISYSRTASGGACCCNQLLLFRGALVSTVCAPPLVRKSWHRQRRRSHSQTGGRQGWFLAVGRQTALCVLLP